MHRYGYRPRLELLEQRCLPASFTVWNTRDEGAGSLRQAILDANAHVNENGADRIAFRILGLGSPVIRPQSALPTVMDPVIIDGGTQPGFGLGWRIVIDGSNAGFSDGLHLTGGDSTVRSLVIGGFAGAGLRIDSNDNVVEGNYLGTNSRGDAARSNGFGLVVSGKYNRIGTNGDGVRDRAEGNVISGNQAAGVVILTQQDPPEVPPPGPPTDDFEETTEEGPIEEPTTPQFPDQHNVVAGNRIGTDASGTLPLGNGWNGQARITVETRMVTTTLTRYVPITVCDEHGCWTEYRVEEMQVAYPVRGFGVSIEVADVGSVSPGVLIAGNANQVGGPGALRNTVAFNGGAGVAVAEQDVFADTSFTGNRIQGNALFANGGPSIDLGEDGVTFNDPGDSDRGPNLGQNFPTIRQVQHGQTTRVQGSLQSQPLSPFTVDFYAGSAGFGAGRRYLGAAQVITDASGHASFDVLLPARTTSGKAVAATATDAAGNTSELSFAARGTVTTWEAGGTLFVIGNGRKSQAVRVAALPEAGAFEVTDGHATRTFAGVEDIHIAMLGRGHDAVFLDGAAAPLEVGGDLTVYTTDGRDSLWAHRLVVEGSADFQMGLGHDRVCLVNSQFAGDLSIHTGGGDDRLSIDAATDPISSFHGPVVFVLGDGNDVVDLSRFDEFEVSEWQLHFDDALWIDGGLGHDRLTGAAILAQDPQFLSIEDDFFTRLSGEETRPPAP